MHRPRILAFGGSLGRRSLNDRLARAAARGAEAAGAEVNCIHLADFPMALYSPDLEAASGLDPEGARFKALLAAHDGWIIASPEYNGGLSAALKNAIDWASRREREDEPPLAAFQGKAAVIMAASPGALGGLRGLLWLRTLLNNLGVLVLPEQYALPGADRAFAEDGHLRDAAQRERVEALGRRLVEVCRGLAAAR